MQHRIEERMAKWWIAQLKNGTIAYSEALSRIRTYLHKAGLTLRDIGTSEAELEKYRVVGCKQLALHFLQRLRDGTIMYKVYMQSLRNVLEEGHLSLDDIGSCDNEFASFAVVDDATFKKRLGRKNRSLPVLA